MTKSQNRMLFSFCSSLPAPEQDPRRQAEHSGCPQPVFTAVIPDHLKRIELTQILFSSAHRRDHIEKRNHIACHQIVTERIGQHAETAERRLREEAEAQRARMAEHAEALAAGVQLLRDRLARVDDRLNSASMDLENATGAIYQALDDTKRDLDALGADLRTFGRETAPAVPAQPPAPARQAEPPRAKATPRRVRPVRQPAPPEPVKRLRRAARGQRPVSQELGEALDRLDKQT